MRHRSRCGKDRRRRVSCCVSTRHGAIRWPTCRRRRRKLCRPLPGGRSPEYLRLDVRVLEMIRQFDRLKKPIAAVCHGPQLLTAAGIIAGRKISAYPAVKPEVEMAGATYVELPMTGAVTDGHFVTAPAWPAHPEWLRQLLELLK